MHRHETSGLELGFQTDTWILEYFKAYLGVSASSGHKHKQDQINRATLLKLHPRWTTS